ncbi:hypothetical protein Cri9333_1521 [Crinalium epipsammum PCC 9333]|uniref:Uncharacterized protein n=1 Tax=Crinalium epipsammum PCC 9333 TaxID=1173022 RepID=K9VWD2_9CYAN|nr:hypothetical protein [Crinalium epipsammum]AFZ12413.1 hypothetical protein Cri9333_1521 [Crinalium epipsammum PCC 9333]
MSRISDYGFMLTFGFLVSTAAISATKASGDEILLRGVVYPQMTITPETESTTTEFSLELNSNDYPLTIEKDEDSTLLTKLYSIDLQTNSEGEFTVNVDSLGGYLENASGEKIPFTVKLAESGSLSPTEATKGKLDLLLKYDRKNIGQVGTYKGKVLLIIVHKR